MPIYRVQAPDGSILRIDGPPLASDEELQQAAMAHYNAATTPGTTPKEGPSFLDKLKAAGEAGAALATGATGGTVGMIGGTLKGLAQQILSGQFGTPQAADLVEQEAMKGAEALTYAPNTQLGQEYTQNVAEAAAPLAAVAPLTGELGAISQAAKLGAPVAKEIATPAISKAAQTVKTAAAPVIEKAKGAAEGIGFGERTAGAAETPAALQRIEISKQLPVPFEGKSALTSGQASRDFAQLQFEKETAKRGDIGAPLRERAENQTANMIQNFDALVDRLEPVSTSKRELGAAVDKALVNRVNIKRQEIKKAYQAAEDAGDLQEPIEVSGLPKAFADIEELGSTSPETVTLVNGLKNRALKYGDVIQDANGNLQAATVPIKQTEDFRKFINASTDWQDPRSSAIAKRLISSIDDATEGKGGEAYRKARKLRQQYANEFENTGLTSKLLGTKRGTSERQIALDDVFDKVIVASPLEEMNKVRSSLLQGGAEGKQAWNDLKAAGIDRIKNASLSQSATDSQGNPLLSPDKLQRVIKQMDESGKLESLYGKKQAQTIRDLGDIAGVIYTAPPGAINHSNTASALQVALDSVGTFAVTGIPAPAATALKEAAGYLKNRKVRLRIQDALSTKLKKSEF